jgi:desulfoferrodoxin-like iron-binding protein
MNETGKRYVCSTCGSELLVTRGGEGALSCCGQPMQIRGAAVAPGEPTQKREG